MEFTETDTIAWTSVSLSVSSAKSYGLNVSDFVKHVVAHIAILSFLLVLVIFHIITAHLLS